MKSGTIKRWAKLTIVGALGMVGLLAAICEPTEEANFMVAMILKIVVMVTSWLTAFALGAHWDINQYTDNN